jgi:hypothetical protein
MVEPMTRFGFLCLCGALCLAIAGCAVGPPSATKLGPAASAVPASGLPRVKTDPTRSALLADRVRRNVESFDARLKEFEFAIFGQVKIVLPSQVRMFKYAEAEVRREPFKFIGLKTPAEKTRAALDPFAVEVSTIALILAKRRMVSDMKVVYADDPDSEQAGEADMVLWVHFPAAGGFEWRMRTWDNSRSRQLIQKVRGNDKSINYELLILDAEYFVLNNSAFFPRKGSQRSKANDRFPGRGLAMKFPARRFADKDVAVIIGNANYNKLRRSDIPDVLPAYADNALMRRYAAANLGVFSYNMINLTDATVADFVSVFGTADDPRGRLHDMVKPNSNVFIYYSGHGAPGPKGKGSYLVPSDAGAARIHLTGYSLKTLYANLEKLPAKSVTVVLEACFSGLSQGGSVIPNASGITVTPKAVRPPSKITLISAGASDQIASWDVDKRQSMFTRHFARAMAGAADQRAGGNRDGKVSLSELKAYLDKNLTYDARRYYGRDQNAQIYAGGVAVGP